MPKKWNYNAKTNFLTNWAECREPRKKPGKIMVGKN